MLTLYNTLSRSKQSFTPLQPGKVSLYTCGPTVYNFAHIGNLRTYVFEDILHRVLKFNRYTVNQVMNITDVGHLTDDADSGDDKMEAGAAREKKSVWEIAQFYTEKFFQDTADLNLLEPTIICKATDHIQEQLDLIKILETKGFTYQTTDGIYFDTSKLSDYGKLAKLDVAGLEAGTRIEMGEKKQPTDFALWKFSPQTSQRQMEWNSPWGVGFPGWHIECSAMSLKYLGDHFDMHCGGIDHIPVHHTNEIAQNEAAVGHQTVNYWLHGEFLLTSDDHSQDKMSKSKGNFLTLQLVKDKGYDPLAYRYFCLTAHYQAKLNFSWEALDGARNALTNIRSALQTLASTTQALTKVDTVTMEKFTERVNDDLDMPGALAILWSVLKSDMAAEIKLVTIFEMDEVFGLELFGWYEDCKVKLTAIDPRIYQLLQDRTTAKNLKDWKQADAIRLTIEEAGYKIEDTADGPRVIPQ